MPTNKGVSILLLTWNSSGRSQRNMHLQLPFQPSCQVHHSAQEYYFFFVVFSCCQNKKPPTELLFKIFSFDYAHLNCSPLLNRARSRAVYLVLLFSWKKTHCCSFNHHLEDDSKTLCSLLRLDISLRFTVLGWPSFLPGAATFLIILLHLLNVKVLLVLQKGSCWCHQHTVHCYILLPCW